MKKNVQIALLLLSLLLVGFATGCGTKASARVETNADGNTNKATKVRIMGVSNYLPLIVANEKGFLQEAFGANVTVEYKQADSGSVVMETMTAGEVDLAALGDMPIVQAKANGQDVKIISSFFQSTAGYELIAAKDSGIRTISDLKGKKVAVMSGSVNHKLLLKYLQSAGLTTNDIEIVFLKNKDQLAAFVGKNVDAAVATVPTSTKIIAETGAYAIADAGGYDNILIYVAGRNRFLQENPGYTKAFLEAVDKATTWIEEHTEEAFQLVAQVQADTPENVKLYYNTRTFFYALDEKEKTAITDTISYLKEQGTIKKDIAVSDLVDDTYIKQAGVSHP